MPHCENLKCIRHFVTCQFAADKGASVFARCMLGYASAMFLVEMIADADYCYFYSIFSMSRFLNNGFCNWDASPLNWNRLAFLLRKYQIMKKLFFSSSGGDPRAQSTFLGKVLHVGPYNCTVEEVIAEGEGIFTSLGIFNTHITALIMFDEWPNKERLFNFCWFDELEIISILEISLFWVLPNDVQGGCYRIFWFHWSQKFIDDLLL